MKINPSTLLSLTEDLVKSTHQPERIEPSSWALQSLPDFGTHVKLCGARVRDIALGKKIALEAKDRNMRLRWRLIVIKTEHKTKNKNIPESNRHKIEGSYVSLAVGCRPK